MKKLKMNRQETQVRAEFQPQSYDKKNRTVDLIWSTGSRVKRYDWQRDTYYWEELVMEPSAIRMERLQNGAPVLNNHSNWDLRDVIGVVSTASVANGKGEAKVRFSQRDDVQGIVQDVEDGILRNISVGYKVHKIERTNERIDDIPVYRVIDWEPLEVSIVGIPADAKSQIRNETDCYECEIINPEENDMGKRSEDSTETVEPKASEATPSETEASATPAQADQTDAGQEANAEGEQPTGEQPNEEAARSETPSTPASPSADEIRALEITRQTEIRTAVRLANLGEDVGDELANNPKMTADEARKEIFKRLENNEPTTNNQRFEVKDMDAKQVRKEQATRAILHRFDTKFEMKQGDGVFGQGSLLDVARNFLHAEGVKDAYTMSRTEVAKRALHSSSDFPEVLANVANKSLRDGYDGVANTYAPFVSKKNVSDFKEISSVVLGNGGKLEKVLESGEYKRTTIEESAEKYKIEKFGTIIGKTWELLVNDDLGAFTSIARKMGVRAKEKENEIFWNIILANPLMAETGKALFHADHGNLAGAGAIANGTLGAARKAMRLMKDLEGELAGITPSYLVVPASLETDAEAIFAAITPNQSSQTNSVAKSLKGIIVEGRLDANSTSKWYVMSDAQKIAMAEMALLDGKGPEMFVREGFDVDGMELKIRYCFGMKVMDYRGFYRNG